MSERTYMRQLGFYNPTDRPHDHVTFIGVGGIGSFAAFGVAKLGVANITLIDPDVVEEHNQPNQFPNASYLGEPKVRAMSEIISWEMPDTGKLDTYQRKAEERVEPYTGVVVSGLDSMSSRASVWDKVKLNPRVPLYLDGRLSGEFMVMYAVNPLDLDDIDSYEKTLHSDEEGEDISCTARGIIDVGLMIGSIITRAVRRHFNGDDVPRITMMNQATLHVTQGGWVE